MTCEAFGCGHQAKHYTTNPSTGRGFHFCYYHMSYHTQGIGFDVKPLEPAKPAEALLTGEGPTAILELPAHTIVALPAGGTVTLKEKPMSALSALTDAQSEAQDAINEIDDRLNDLNDAKEQLQDLLDNLSQAISVLEDLDGFSVSVDVDSISVDVSLYI